MSRGFGRREPSRNGDRICRHCGKGRSDHFLAMSERRCFLPKDSTRFEPINDDAKPDVSALDGDDFKALEALFKLAALAPDTKQIMKSAGMRSAVAKPHIMHERAKAGAR